MAGGGGGERLAPCAASNKNINKTMAHLVFTALPPPMYSYHALSHYIL